MANPTIDDRTFQQQFEQAQTAAVQANQTEPRAIAAYYDSNDRVIIIRLRSGASFSFPPNIAQGLSQASPEDLAQVEITPMGDGLHWENLDADFTIAGLLAGRFGSKKWMQQLNHQWLQQAS